MVGQDILEEREPEDTNLCEELALVGDSLCVANIRSQVWYGSHIEKQRAEREEESV